SPVRGQLAHPKRRPRPAALTDPYRENAVVPYIRADGRVIRSRGPSSHQEAHDSRHDLLVGVLEHVMACVIEAHRLSVGETLEPAGEEVIGEAPVLPAPEDEHRVAA